MSGDGKRSVAEWPKLPRPSSTLPTPKCCDALRISGFGVDRRSSTHLKSVEIDPIRNFVRTSMRAGHNCLDALELTKDLLTCDPPGMARDGLSAAALRIRGWKPGGVKLPMFCHIYALNEPTDDDKSTVLRRRQVTRTGVILRRHW